MYYANIAVCKGGIGCRLRVSVFFFFSAEGEVSLALLPPRPAGLAVLRAMQVAPSVSAAGASRLDFAVNEKAYGCRLQPGGRDQLQLP